MALPPFCMIMVEGEVVGSKPTRYVLLTNNKKKTSSTVYSCNLVILRQKNLLILVQTIGYLYVLFSHVSFCMYWNVQHK